MAAESILEHPRRLVLLRHAKSAWPLNVPDIDRPLNERGTRDAPAAGRWISESVGECDLIVVSPALRTRQTVDLLAQTWSTTPEIIVDDRVYEAHWTTLAAVIATLPEQVRSVLLVGHNPGVSELALRWPGRGDPQAAATAEEKFPTSAVAVIEVSGPWEQPMDSYLQRVSVPRG